MEESWPSFLAPETDPAAAFAHLAEKVDMLEAAIAGLAAKSEAAPHHRETLGIIAHNLNAYGAMVKAMRQSQALQITPQEMAARVAAAGETIRAKTATIARSRQTLDCLGKQYSSNTIWRRGRPPLMGFQWRP